MIYQFTQAASETGYLFQQNGNNSYAHLTTGEFIITAGQDTELVITTYTRQSTNTGEMATFVNDDLLTIQSSIDGIIEKRIALRAHEPVTVFVENFALLPYNSNTGTPTYVLFNADCPLEIIKHDGLPFHRIYRTEDGQSYGASDLRILLENYVFNELPAELKQGIKTVVNRQSAWDIETAALVPETTHDRLWIPSENEYFNSRLLSPDSTELLGNGVIHGINGFGVDRMIGRSVLGYNSSYHYNTLKPTLPGHGGGSSKLHELGYVMICFGL